VENYSITISSEKQELIAEKDGEKIIRPECSYSSFKRSFQLSENVNKDQISATYDQGLLKLTLPKTEPKQVANKKRIEIG